MAGPGGREVGRVSVRVLPDTSNFASSLERYLERTEKRLRLQLPVSLEAGDVAKVDAELDALSRDRKVELKLDVDKSILGSLDKSISGASSAAGGLSHAAVIVAAIAAALPALLALPSLLAAIAAPIGVIVAGFDGIKKAAAALSGPLTVLKGVISSAFADQLTPVFKQLLKVFPVLIGGFSSIAHAISVAFGDVVDAIISPAGLAAISDTFTNIATAIFGLAPSFGKLTTLFLTLMDQGSKAMVNFLPALVQIVDKFVALTNFLVDSGILAKAFATFNFLLGATLVLIAAVVIAGTAFYAGLNLIATGIGDVVAALVIVVVAFGSLPGRIGAALSGLVGIVGGAFTAAWGAAVSATKTAIGSVVTLAGSLGSKVVSAVGDLSGVLFDAGKSVIQGFLDGIGSMFGAVKGKLGDLTGKLTSWKGPESLDKVILRQSGQLVIGGFIDGLEDGFSGVKSSLGGLTSKLPSFVATSGSAFLDGTGSAPAAAGNVHPIVLDGMVTGYVHGIVTSVVADTANLAATTGRQHR